MKISKAQFIVITALFILLPFSVHWKLLVFGEKTTATVIGQKQVVTNDSTSILGTSGYSILRFEAEGEKIEFPGPSDLIYDPGTEITVFYKKGDPHKHIMYNFAGLFLNLKTVIPFVLLLLWFAFYFSMKKTY
ncbi:MAG: hypothetical protein MI922_00125 [Bacteroidales bacterium]|nr:hypothetical protein [Bacteroidales bacterium]